MKKSYDLPQELWNHIFEKLDESDLEQVSLVSKQFLSITDPLKKGLTILKETLLILPSVLKRFQNLESITISNKHVNVDIHLLRLISRSSLDCEWRKNLKGLKLLGELSSLSDDDLMEMADLFPSLEEITFTWVTKSLPRLNFGALRSVTFQSKHCSDLDKTLKSLSSNCVNLEEVDVEIRCNSCISEETIGFMMRHSPKLTTLKLPRFWKSSSDTSFYSIQNSVTYAKNLHTICFCTDILSNELVQALGEANLLNLQIRFKIRDREINHNYLLELFRRCSSIQHLTIRRDIWLLDSSVDTMSQQFKNLTHVDLSWCTELRNSSFFSLTTKYPFLEEIKMDTTQIGVGKFSQSDLHKNEKIRRLSLRNNRFLDDKTLGYILQVCPNLNFIDVSCCRQLTEEGVQGILKSCVLLNHLNISELENIYNIFGKYFEGKTLNLKILEARYTSLNDEALGEIGKICSGLEFLVIRDCEQVTNNGVMEVMKNCRRLKKINLCGCQNLSTDILNDIVWLRPSIKRICLPLNFVPSEEQTTFFSENGCRICDSFFSEDGCTICDSEYI